MIIRLTFKTPDVVDNQIYNLSEEQYAEFRKVADKFIQWGEYVRIEIDTEAETATVIPYK